MSVGFGIHAATIQRGPPETAAAEAGPARRGRARYGYVMLTLLRKLFWVLVGVAAALEADRWIDRQKVRMSPHAVTGSLLDKLNEGLEKRAVSRTTF
ncbi:MAG: hypothetical protein ABR529_01925 [Actinomycetota bacterium]